MRKKLIALLLTMAFTLTFVCPVQAINIGSGFSSKSKSTKNISLPSLPSGSTGGNISNPGSSLSSFSSLIPSAGSTSLPSLPSISTGNLSNPGSSLSSFSSLIPSIGSTSLPSLPSISTGSNIPSLSPDELSVMMAPFINNVSAGNLGTNPEAILQTIPAGVIESYAAEALADQIIKAGFKGNKAELTAMLTPVITNMLAGQVPTSFEEVLKTIPPGVIESYAADALADQIIKAGFTGDKAQLTAMLVPVISGALAGQVPSSPEDVLQMLPADVIAVYAADALADQIIKAGFKGNKAELTTMLVPVISAALAGQVPSSPEDILKTLPAGAIKNYGAEALADQIIKAGFTGDKAQLTAMLVPVISGLLAGEVPSNPEDILQMLPADLIAEFAADAIAIELIKSGIIVDKAQLKTMLIPVISGVLAGQVPSDPADLLQMLPADMIAEVAADAIAVELIKSGIIVDKAQLKAMLIPVISGVLAGQFPSSPEGLLQVLPADVIAAYAADALADQIIKTGFTGDKAQLKAMLIPVIKDVIAG